MRRRVLCAGWALVTMALGLVVRMGPLGLPWGVAKYGGSALWAVMIYWVLCVGWSRWGPVRVGCVASLIAVAVEFGKLYRSPGMDAFRLTLAGKLLLGRYFSGWDILAYLVGIWLVVAGELCGGTGKQGVTRIKRMKDGSEQTKALW